MPVERERLAYICNHKSHGELPQRVFLLPGDAVPPRCSDGHPMVRQINVPYKDQTSAAKKRRKK